MTADEQGPVFIKRVRIKNFRSIAHCDVTLGPLTVLLGFNASGKSNFLDALKFVKDALSVSPLQAITDRGGIDELMCRTAEPSDPFEIWLDLDVRVDTDAEPIVVSAFYGFQVSRSDDDQYPYRITGEEFNVDLFDSQHLPAGFSRSADDYREFRSNAASLTGIRSDRLLLPSKSVEYSPAWVFDALVRQTFYELDTEKLRAVDQDVHRPERLGPEGEHLGHILSILDMLDPAGKERLDAYMSALIPGALGVDERPEGRFSTIEARFRAQDEGSVEVFGREALSEGTVRAAGVLTALLQPATRGGATPLVAIEEPETALHPATVGALYEALTDAADRTQVLITTQSADLLNNEYAEIDHIRVVANKAGSTHIGTIDSASRSLIESKSSTLSDLHRNGQLLPTQVGYPVEERH